MQRIAVGVDLAAKPESSTGLCVVVEEVLVDCVEAQDDYDIIDKVFSYGKPLAVAMDAPLTTKSKGFRVVELEMIKNGMSLLPLGFPYMRRLARRGVSLKRIIEEKGVKVIETHPTSSLKSAGCSRDGWMNCLSRYIRLSPTIGSRVDGNKDLVDAAVAAGVAWLYLNNATRVFRGPDGEIHILP